MTVYGFVTSSRDCSQHLRLCPACGKETFHALRRQREWLTLFFVPVLPLGRGRGVKCCNLCGQETAEGPDHAAAPGAEAGTKKCPECAELIKIEARLCRYCHRRFSEEENAAARQLALPGSLWSIVIGVVLVLSVAKDGLLPGRVVLVVAAWLVLSLPLWTGMLFRRKSRSIRERLDDSPGDAPETLAGVTAPSP